MGEEIETLADLLRPGQTAKRPFTEFAWLLIAVALQRGGEHSWSVPARTETGLSGGPPDGGRPGHRGGRSRDAGASVDCHDMADSTDIRWPTR
jgi:hypothetical protein